MRIFASITLVVALVFVCMPSVNSDLWGWFSNASLLTKILATFSLVALVSIVGYQAIGIRVSEIPLRVWRNFAFLATTATVGFVMVAMLILATVQTTPSWLLASLAITSATALVGWANFNLGGRSTGSPS